MAVLLLAALAAPPGAAPGCFATARDVPQGAVLRAEDLVAVDCREDSTRTRLGYDRAARAPVANAPLAAGTYLGRVAPPSGAMVAPGEQLTLRSSAGPVIIERTVTALQLGRSGGRLFVRDAQGQVFSVRYVAEDRP